MSDLLTEYMNMQENEGREPAPVEYGWGAGRQGEDTNLYRYTVNTIGNTVAGSHINSSNVHATAMTASNMLTHYTNSYVSHPYISANTNGDIQIAVEDQTVTLTRESIMVFRELLRLSPVEISDALDYIRHLRDSGY